jgi:outer membrane protein
MRVLIATSLLAALVDVSSLAAQAPQAVLDRPVPRRLTLADALARATETSHVLGELKAREQASEAVLAQSRAADMPVLAVEGGYTRTNHVSVFGFTGDDGLFRVIYPDVPDNWRTRVDMQWPIYTGGRAQALDRAAAAERQASGKDLTAARSDLTLETTRAFWALVTATESVRVVLESVTRVEGQLNDVKARFDAGFLPPNDVLIDAENQRDGARAALARLIGAPIDAAFDPDATLDLPRGLGASTTIQALAEQAKSGRADRQALLFRTEAADERIDAARAGSRPQVALGAGYDYAHPNPNIFPRQDAWKPSWQLGFNVGWTLFNGGRTSAEVAEARSLSTAVRERLAELDTQIVLEVRQRQLDLASAMAAVQPAMDAVTSATEARRVVQERFGAGVATSTDLLDAQQDQLEAELGRTRALANVKLAEARLARALGQ